MYVSHLPLTNSFSDNLTFITVYDRMFVFTRFFALFVPHIRLLIPITWSEPYLRDETLVIHMSMYVYTSPCRKSPSVECIVLLTDGSFDFDGMYAGKQQTRALIFWYFSFRNLKTIKKRVYQRR